MAVRVWDAVLDGGLAVLDSTALAVYLLNSLEVFTYKQVTTPGATAGINASSTAGYLFGIGYYGVSTFAAGALFPAPIAGSTTGRRVSSVAISAGTITSTGIVTAWAVVSASSLLAAGSLSAASTFTSTANTFSIPSFDVTLPASST